MKRRKRLDSVASKAPDRAAVVSKPAQAVLIHPITFEWVTSVGQQSVVYVERRFLN